MKILFRWNYVNSAESFIGKDIFFKKHQRSKGCIAKAKTPEELGNRSILDYFETVSDLKTLFLPIAETGLIICTLNVIKF